jgi:hypothetical protein
MRHTGGDVVHDHERDPRHPVRQRADEARAPAPPAARHPLSVARTPATDASSLIELQRLAGNAGVVQMLAAEDEAAAESPVLDVVGKGGGRPLDPGTRATMEQAFGDDFGDVRVHADQAASRSAESVAANAYTVGHDIVVRDGHGPGSPGFQRTVAHELEHVRQQRQGPVDGTDTGGGIRVSDPADQFERAADAKADQVLAATRPTAPEAGGGDAVPGLQRETSEEDDEELTA